MVNSATQKRPYSNFIIPFEIISLFDFICVNQELKLVLVSNTLFLCPCFRPFANDIYILYYYLDCFFRAAARGQVCVF